MAAAVEVVIALAWQPPQQRSIDLVIAAGFVLLALAATWRCIAWRLRYLEELYDRAYLASDKRRQAPAPGGRRRSPGRDTYVGYHRDLRRLTRMRALLDLVIARLAN
jgi:hypothetical protein